MMQASFALTAAGLPAVQVYKRKDPASADEVELLENLFDCLCSALLEGDNRPRFLQSEGVELMVILIKCVRRTL